MDAMPMEDASKGWDRDLPVTVLPLGLDDFMECFWADAAPYYIPALVLDREKDEVVNYTNWTTPSEEEKKVMGDDILGTRRIEKRMHTSAVSRAFTYPYVIQHIALKEQTDTNITIMVLQTQSGAPYATAYQEWFKYEILTADPRSHQVVVR